MRKANWLIFLFFMSSPAMAVEANWVKVDDNQVHTVFIEKSTFQIKGSKRVMWNLKDYKTLQEINGIKPYLSMKAQEEYDCSDGKTRILYFSLHSGRMGSGDAIFNHVEPDKWLPSSPGSVRELLWKIACNKF